MGTAMKTLRRPGFWPGLCLALCLAVGQAFGLEAARPDSVGRGEGGGLRAPFWIMMRSAVVPGWGQLANGKPLKALVVALGEGYLIERLVFHERARRRALRKAEEEPERADDWEAEADRHRERRNDFTWWTGLAVALSMGDAFVDAHLRDFEAEFSARDAGEDEPIVEFRLTWRLPW
jgi:hypothetical protein